MSRLFRSFPGPAFATRALLPSVLLACLVLGASAQAAPAPPPAEFRPTAETYVCPNVLKPGLDCFLDAVDHLYTMCRHVKSIEVIEFGLEHAEEGVNGAKSESCVDKQKGHMTRPLQTALREASRSKDAAEAIKNLHEIWMRALTDLKWRPPETTEEYQQRITSAYDAFHERADVIRTSVTEAQAAQAAAQAAKSTKTTKAAPAQKSAKAAAPKNPPN
jgi:hypothetical protein